MCGQDTELGFQTDLGGLQLQLLLAVSPGVGPVNSGAAEALRNGDEAPNVQRCSFSPSTCNLLTTNQAPG